MTSRAQIAFDPETQRRARRRASDMGVSLAEYVRRLVARDLAAPQRAANPAAVFDLGASAGSDIAADKDAMLAEAFASARRQSRAKAVLSRGEPLVTTDHILVETWTLIR